MSVRVRGLLAGLAAAGVAVVVSAPEIVAQATDQRTISIYNIHTKETVSAVYRRNGQYVPAGMKQVNHAMRDWRQNEATEMDPALVDILWEVHSELGSKEPIHLISGFRSRKTNDNLRENVGGQVKNSRHIMGKAADVHFPDVPIKRLRYSALIREKGGVGYYPTSAIPFVHLDTDRVRHWPPMPRYELALLFPDGQSKHVPSDGQPITREDVRVAQSRHKDLAVQIAEFFDVRQRPGPQPGAGRTVLASLSGPFPVAAPATAPRATPEQQLARTQMASLTGGAPGILSIPKPSAVPRKEPAPTEAVTLPPVAAPSPRPVLATLAPAASKPLESTKSDVSPKSEDSLGALVRRKLAALTADERKSEKAAAKAAAIVAAAPVRLASADPRAGLNPGLADPIGDKITGEIQQGWPSGFAQAPAFDEEHPEELSYRPFSISPILTQHAGHDHPVLAQMHHPDTGRLFDMLDEPDRLFPLSFRPGQQVAELMWAGQFNGAKVGADTLMARLKTAARPLIIQRHVATTSQR